MTPASETAASGRAHSLLAECLVWDDHGCMPLRPDDEAFLPQLTRYREAGVDVCCLNVGYDVTPWESCIRMLAHFRHWVRRHPDQYLLVDGVEDVARARREEKLAVAFDLEGGTALGGQLSMVQLYYELGVRWMLIAYNRNNEVGGGCQDDDRGLTTFGRQVVDEMARVGMVTCCTHAGYRTTMEVMERATGPVIFSHSNPAGVWQHKRNIRDEAIRACAATGGVVALNGIGLFLGENDISAERFVEHLDYVVQLVGVEHVGLGLDFVFDRDELDAFVIGHPEMFPPEEGYGAGIRMIEPEQLPDIVECLLRRGYSEPDVAAILGGNHLRVAERVWK